MTREAASNHDIAAFSRSIKQVTKLGEEMLKVTIHRENIPAGSSRESVRKSQANSVRRSPMQWLDSAIPRGQFINDFSGTVGATVIHRNYFVNIVAVECKDSFR